MAPDPKVPDPKVPRDRPPRAAAPVGPQRELRPRKLARLPEGHPPVVLVTIDAEEEFDWSAPFDRHSTGASAMDEVGRLQDVLDRHGVVGTWVVDHPVAAQTRRDSPLREIALSGRATIGAHLHPWVTPPHEEDVTARNSFPGNLPPELERAKLRATIAAVETAFGRRPVCYQAGRYGIGPNTAALLEEHGFEVDFSVCPPFDYRPEGGPDFSHFGCETYWFGRKRLLLGIPLTGGYVGLWPSLVGHGAHGLYRWATGRLPLALHLPGLLARAKVLDRLRLTPEGFDRGHHRRLARALLARGIRVFVYSLHSPSLKPGCTPYVRTEADRDELLARTDAFLDFFLRELGGVALTPLELKARCLGPQPR